MLDSQIDVPKYNSYNSACNCFDKQQFEVQVKLFLLDTWIMMDLVYVEVKFGCLTAESFLVQVPPWLSQRGFPLGTPAFLTLQREY